MPSAPAPFLAHAADVGAAAGCHEDTDETCPRSACGPVDCSAGDPPCFDRTRVQVRPYPVGRIEPGDATITVASADGVITCTCGVDTHGWRCGPRCHATLTPCETLGLDVTAAGLVATGWNRPCAGTHCRVRADAEQVVVEVAAAPATEGPPSIAWRHAAPEDVVFVVAGGTGTWVATATESSRINATVPEAGSIVFRRATTLRVFDLQGRPRWERRLGGVAGDVRPQDVLATPTGGALLAARFPDDPVLPLGRGKTRVTTRPRTGPRLRIVAFSPEGDPLWTVTPTLEGRARLLAHPTLGPVVAVEGLDALGLPTHRLEVLALADDGSIRWRWQSKPGDALARGRLVGVAPTDDAIVLATMRRIGDGWRPTLIRVPADGTHPTVIAVEGTAPRPAASLARLGDDAFVLGLTDRVLVIGGDGQTKRRLAPTGTDTVAGVPPHVASMGDGAVLAWPLPHGFEILRTDDRGELRWIERRHEDAIVPLALARGGERPVLVGVSSTDARTDDTAVVTVAFEP